MIQTLTRILLLALLALCSTAPALAADLYQVEMIVFQRWGDAQGEDFGALTNQGKRHAATGDVASKVAGRASWRLQDQAAKLSSKGYKILFHQAWRQAAGSRSDNAWYALGGPGLKGTVRLTRGRYLHVDIDFDVSGVRVREHRRMRSRVLHYIDHPRVGVLVRVDGYTPAAVAQ